MTNTKVRRSGCIPRQIPIVLIGSDAEGLVFSEETKTVVLSRQDAGIVSLYKLISEQELHLSSLESNRETEVRVVGEIGTEGSAHTYGVAFTDPTIDFWQTSISCVKSATMVAPHARSGRYSEGGTDSPFRRLGRIPH